MGFPNRDSARRPSKILPFARKANWQKRLVAATAIIGVLSAIVLLVRSTAELKSDLGPAPGSLIVNINTATEEQLQTVPGVGPTRAAQIVVGRPYGSVDELLSVVGIAAETLEGLRPFVTTEGETRKREQ